MNQEQNQAQVCPDKEMNGTCTKGADCPICNKETKTESQEKEKLNLNAQEYVPKNKKTQEKLNFNLNAKDYIPKNVIVNGQDENGEDEVDEDDMIDEQMDMIMKDVIEDEMVDELADDSEDEDKWFPKYKDCPCCKGFVFKCSGVSCQSLGQCYCKMKDDCEDN